MKFKQILPPFIALLIGVFIGYQISQSLEPSAFCPAPSNLTEIASTETSITVSWTTVPAARYYTIIARDTTKPDDVAGSIVVEGTTSGTIPDLKPGTRYFVDVFSICEQNGTFRISETPQTIKASTIITDDVVLFDGTDCPFNNCPTQVNVTNNCFNWGAGTQYYSVEIINPAGTVVFARTYLEKLVTSTGIRVRNYNSATPCIGASTLNPPSKSAGCPASSFCGTFTDGGGIVNYSLVISTTNCCLSAPAGYTLRVRSCTPPDR